MTYPSYYIALLNFINGRNLRETTPPDSVTEDEKSMMATAYEKIDLLTADQIEAMLTMLGTSLADLYNPLVAVHERLHALRKHGFTLHAKETLWLETLDKALPCLQKALLLPWSTAGAWSPKNYEESKDSDAVWEEKDILHALLVAMIEFAVRELGMHEFET